MPKKKEPDPNEKPQKERFIEFAREVGADKEKDKDALETGFKRVVSPPSNSAGDLGLGEGKQ